MDKNETNTGNDGFIWAGRMARIASWRWCLPLPWPW
jgi:hypothetical protein